MTDQYLENDYEDDYSFLDEELNELMNVYSSDWSTNILSSSQSSSQDNAEPSQGVPKRKRRHRKNTRRPSVKPAYMPDIRVLKTDIRRKFGEMYVNVTNSHDPELIQQFYGQFCRPDCSSGSRFQQGCQFGDFLAPIFQPVDRMGVPFLLNGHLAVMTFFPDSVSRLKKFEVRVTRGVPGSKLIATIFLQGSMMYDLKAVPPSSPDFEEIGEPTGQQPNNYLEFMNPIDPNEKIYFGLRPQPFPVSVTFDLIMNLDDCNRIHSFFVQSSSS